MLRREFCLTTAILFLGAVKCLATDRTLTFPEDRNYGTLSICPPPTESEFISGFTVASEFLVTNEFITSIGRKLIGLVACRHLSFTPVASGY